ncbi:CD320 antigen [Guaruba guarouba]
MARLPVLPVLPLLLLLPPVRPLPPPPERNGERTGGGGVRAALSLSRALIGSPRTPFVLIGCRVRTPSRRGSPWRGVPHSARSPPAATLLRCPPGLFRCAPGAPCVTTEWRCDGHPDCDDGEDELGCGTVPPAEPSPGGAETSTTPVPEGSAPSSSPESLWILVIAALLSILVAVASIAVWGISKAKSRSDVFSPEKASREQLIPDKSQRGSFPQRGSVPHGDETGPAWSPSS